MRRPQVSWGDKIGRFGRFLAAIPVAVFHMGANEAAFFARVGLGVLLTAVCMALETHDTSSEQCCVAVSFEILRWEASATHFLSHGIFLDRRCMVSLCPGFWCASGDGVLGLWQDGREASMPRRGKSSTEGSERGRLRNGV